MTLRKTYSDGIIHDACKRAVSYGAYSYNTLKNICNKNLIVTPTTYNATYINPDKTSVSRDLLEHDKLARLEVK